MNIQTGQIDSGTLTLGVVTVALLVLSCSIANAIQEPLAVLDFSTGEALNMKVVGEQPPVVEFAGHRLLELAAARVSFPMTWPAEQPNPTFPGVDPENMSPAPEMPTVVLDIDQEALGLSGAHDLALVTTVYDITEGHVNSSVLYWVWRTADERSPTSKGKIWLAGDPFGRDFFVRPRLLPKVLVASGAVLDDSLNGGDLEIQPTSRAYVQRIEVYRYAPAVDFAEDFAEVMVQQAHAYAAWVDADDAARGVLRHCRYTSSGTQAPVVREMLEARATLTSRVKASMLAMDEYFYGAKLAAATDDLGSYRRLTEQVRRALRTVTAAARKVSDRVDAANRRLKSVYAQDGLGDVAWARRTRPVTADAERRSPLDRVLFTAFNASPWYSDRYNAQTRHYALLGIKTGQHWMAGLRLNEDGSPGSGLDPGLETIRKMRSYGWDILPGMGYHGKYLAYNWVSRWLPGKSPDDSIYDVNPDGEPRQPDINLCNPVVRDYYQNVVSQFARAIVPNPHVVPWFFWSEPCSTRGYSVSARQAFRDYLQQKYLDVADLNEKWGTDYASFEDIAVPRPPGEVLRTEASGLTYEFEKFRRKAFADWWQLTAAALRRGDPRARLWLDGWGRYDYTLSKGNDQLAMFDAADIGSVHTGSMGQDTQRTWEASLSRYSGTPIADGEINIYGPHYNGFATLDELRAAAEQHVLMQTWYGVRAFMFWGSQLAMYDVYSYGGPCLYDRDRGGPLATSGFALRTVRKKCDRYDDIVKNTEILRPEVAILYSSTSMINSWPYNEVEHETYPIHSWLYHSDYGYWSVHEDAIVDGREDLHHFRAIIVPWAIWLQPEAARLLLDYVTKGGVLISSGPVGAFDQYGRPLNTILQAALGEVEVEFAAHERLGENRLSAQSIKLLRKLGDEMTTHFGGWVWSIKRLQRDPGQNAVLTLADGTPVVYEAEVGAGKVIIATVPLGKNQMRRFVLNEIAQHVRPLVRKTHDDGFHILPRIDAHSNLFLGVFNQSVSETVTDTLLVDGHYRQGLDLSLSGDWPVPVARVGDRTSITLTLEPGEGTVLALGSLLEANRMPRNPRYKVRPEPPLVAWSGPELAQARQEIAQKELPPRARAEAQARLMAARRYGSMGYFERARRLMKQALVTEDNGEVVSFPEDRVQAVRAQAPIKIDGRADEWRDVPRFAVKSSPAAGGQFALQWDDEDLYVLAVVRDDDLKKLEEEGSDVNWIWRYDGILMVLSPANTAPLTVGGALYDAKYRAAQTALLVSITGRKYANSACGFSAAAVRSAAQQVEGGYVMEVAIPLRKVMVPPVPGADLGFEFKVMNNGRAVSFARFADRESWLSDPTHMARLELVGAGS